MGPVSAVYCCRRDREEGLHAPQVYLTWLWPVARRGLPPSPAWSKAEQGIPRRVPWMRERVISTSLLCFRPRVSSHPCDAVLAGGNVELPSRGCGRYLTTNANANPTLGLCSHLPVGCDRLRRTGLANTVVLEQSLLICFGPTSIAAWYALFTAKLRRSPHHCPDCAYVAA